MVAASLIAPQRSEAPDPIDIHVGSRLRLRRNFAGLSQEQLGKAAGLTFQQIQKYERGANRMGASRLFHFAQILNVPVAWFFEGLPKELTDSYRAKGFSDIEQSALDDLPSGDNDLLHKRETLDLVRAWYRIADDNQRRKIFALVKSLADDGSEKN